MDRAEAARAIVVRRTEWPVALNPSVAAARVSSALGSSGITHAIGSSLSVPAGRQRWRQYVRDDLGLSAGNRRKPIETQFSSGRRKTTARRDVSPQISEGEKTLLESAEAILRALENLSPEEDGPPTVLPCV